MQTLKNHLMLQRNISTNVVNAVREAVRWIQVKGLGQATFGNRVSPRGAVPSGQWDAELSLVRSAQTRAHSAERGQRGEGLLAPKVSKWWTCLDFQTPRLVLFTPHYSATQNSPDIGKFTLLLDELEDVPHAAYKDTKWS